MKKALVTRIVLGLCLVLATVGFIMTQGKNPKGTAGSSKVASNMGVAQSATEKVIDQSSYNGESEEERQTYYSSMHALSLDAFERMQTGGINKKIYYSANSDKYHWVMVTDVKRYNEIPEEYKNVIGMYKGRSVNYTIAKQGLDIGDIQSGGYTLIEADLLTSNNFKSEFLCSQNFQLYSANENLPNNFSEGTLLADSNLIYVDASGSPKQNNGYANTVHFADQSDSATFRIIYLVPTSVVEEGNLFIGGSTNIYLEGRGTYPSSAYVIHLDE